MMDEDQKHIGPKQPDPEYMLCDSIMWGSGQIKSTTVIGIRALFAFGGGVTATRQE